MKSLFVEKGGTYRKEGDYFLPNLVAPDAPVLRLCPQMHPCWASGGRGAEDS